MAKGRKPKPVEVKRREGNPGKRPLPDATLIGGRGAPDKPLGLSTVAGSLWDIEVPKMVDAGVLDLCDGPVLGQYFEAWSIAIMAAKEVDENGAMILVPNDFTGEMKTKRNPATIVLKDAQQTMRMIASEYGLTPASRSTLAGRGVDGRSPAAPPDAPPTLTPIRGGKRSAK